MPKAMKEMNSKENIPNKEENTLTITHAVIIK